MLDFVRKRNPGRPPLLILFYDFWQTVSWILFTLIYRYRVTGRHNIPNSGAFIVALNHQSHLDPIIAGTAIRKRHLNFIARSTLFNNKLFGKYITWLNAVPLNQNAPDTQAIRTAIEQLGLGRCVLIFPEGSRTRDGAIHPFKRGVWLLLSRAKVPILPIAIEGAFDAWPRGTSFPKLFGQRLAARIGPPIAPEALLAMGATDGLEHLRQTIETMRAAIATDLRRQGAKLTTTVPNDRDADADPPTAPALATSGPPSQPSNPASNRSSNLARARPT